MNPRQNPTPVTGTDKEAALLLCLMSPFQRRAIWDFLNRFGNQGLSSEQFIPTFERPAVIMAGLSTEHNDIELVGPAIQALSVIHLATYRKPKFGTDDWERVLIEGLGIDQSTAAALANKIETEDILPEGAGFLNNAAEYARQGLNWVLQKLSPTWEVDQDQQFDTDFLYEMYNAGGVIKQVLMRQQAVMTSISTSMNMANPTLAADIESGDINQNPPSSDMGSILMGRPAGPKIAGPFAEIIAFSKTNAITKVAGTDDPSVLKQTASNVVNKIKTTIDASGMTLPAPLRKFGGFVKDLVSDVESEYGPKAAVAFENGDVETLVGEVLNHTLNSHSIGDLEANMDEGDPLDVLTGGLFSTIMGKAGRKSRRAARIEARNARRQAKVDVKSSKRAALSTADARLNAAKGNSPRYDTGTENPQTSGPSFSESDYSDEDGAGFGGAYGPDDYDDYDESDSFGDTMDSGDPFSY